MGRSGLLILASLLSSTAALAQAAPIGAAIGTLVGVSRPGEKWERVDLRRLRVSGGPRGGGAVGLSFVF